MKRHQQAPAEPALSWAVAAGARTSALRRAWRSGQAADVPIGRLWDVVRVTHTYGQLALERLQVQRVPLGLVLEVPTRATIEYLVPRGCAASWPPLLGSRCTNSGAIRWPPPYAVPWTGLRAVCGRQWLAVPPMGSPLTTDENALCETVTAALAHHAIPWAEQS